MTQAYYAGIILSMLHNLQLKEKTPSFVEGVVHFPALRELFGESLWQRLYARVAFRPYIIKYESLTYQPGTPRSLIGTGEDFAMGYVSKYKNSRRKKELDARRLTDLSL